MSFEKAVATAVKFSEDKKKESTAEKLSKDKKKERYDALELQLKKDKKDLRCEQIVCDFTIDIPIRFRFDVQSLIEKLDGWEHSVEARCDTIVSMPKGYDEWLLGIANGSNLGNLGIVSLKDVASLSPELKKAVKDVLQKKKELVSKGKKVLRKHGLTGIEAENEVFEWVESD
jgi:hypothetical protein